MLLLVAVAVALCIGHDVIEWLSQVHGDYITGASFVLSVLEIIVALWPSDAMRSARRDGNTDRALPEPSATAPDPGPGTRGGATGDSALPDPPGTAIRSQVQVAEAAASLPVDIPAALTIRLRIEADVIHLYRRLFHSAGRDRFPELAAEAWQQPGAAAIDRAVAVELQILAPPADPADRAAHDLADWLGALPWHLAHPHPESPGNPDDRDEDEPPCLGSRSHAWTF